MVKPYPCIYDILILRTFPKISALYLCNYNCYIIMLFTVNAQDEASRDALLNHVQSQFPNAMWNHDLQTADGWLEVHGIPENAESAAQVIKSIEETGFKGAWVENS